MFFRLSFILLLINITSQEETYRQRAKNSIHPQRIKSFYRRALEIFSKNKTYPSISHYGIGVFANKDFKTNEVIMEIAPNFTISSFDSYFPYMDIVEQLTNGTYNQYAHMFDILDFRLLLNVNYIRYANNSNRFFRIFFENTLDTFDYLPFWGDEKQIFTKFNLDIRSENTMFQHNYTIFQMLTRDLHNALKKINSDIIPLMLSEERMKVGINLINTRSFPITLKGWKVIHSHDNVQEEDLQYIGKIVMPGADAFNHEHLIPDHPDLQYATIINKKGRIEIRANRAYKKGQELFINYDHFASVSEIFKKYGFVPMDALLSNTVFDRTVITFDWNKMYLAKICLALGSCYGQGFYQNQFFVPSWTNSLDISNLNVERIGSWQDFEIDEYRMIDVFNSIVENRHSNLTEGVAVDKFLYTFYSRVLFASQFKTGIKNMFKMMEMNENSIDVNSILKKNDIKFHLNKVPGDIYFKFKEIINYSLLMWHMTAVNVRSLKPMLHRALDNLINDVKRTILDDYAN